MGLSIISGFPLGLTKFSFKVINTSGRRSSFIFKTERDDRKLWQTSGPQKSEDSFLSPFTPPSKHLVHNENIQQHTLAARKANSIPGCVNRSTVQGRDYPPLLSTCETTSRHWTQFWAPPVQERYQPSGMSSVGAPQIGWRSSCPVRRGWGTGTCSAWRRNGFGEDVTEHPPCTPLWGGLREDGARVSLWCVVGRWEITGISWNKGSSNCRWRKHFPPPWGQACNGAGCQKGLRRLHPLRF